MELASLTTQYLDELRNTRATVWRPYGLSLKLFLRYNISLDCDCLRAFDECLLRDARGYSPATRKNYNTALHQFLTWLYSRDLLPPSVDLIKAKVRYQTQSRRRTNNRSPPRVADRRLPLLLAHFDDTLEPETRISRLDLLRNRALIHVLFSTAARIAEALSLTRHACSEGQIEESIIIGKGDSPRTIFFDPKARQAIQTYLTARADTYPSLFISHRQGVGKALSPSAARVIFKKAASACGLAANTSPHMVRHWVASDMLNRGVPLEIVQQYLGHKDISTTRFVYAITYVATLRTFVNAYHNEEIAPNQQSHLALQVIHSPPPAILQAIDIAA